VTAYHPGDPEYRAYVGPFDQYDVMGATQFALLYALGLRQHHRLLDVGCGSLRAGRMFITYLASRHYVGVEPNTWLIEEAIEHQLGRDLLSIKQPTFRATDCFDFDGLGSFDFVVAQSIASHAGPSLVPTMLDAIAGALGGRGLAAVTFIHAPPEDTEVVHVTPADTDAAAWLYPGCYSYERDAVETWIAGAGLCGVETPWHHPRQTWWLLARSSAALPPAAFVDQLAGVTLAEGLEPSWQAAGVRPAS
jgi:cyclopropane fatty-acyl-phospholipid synthase-like methyltransferase